MLAKKLIKKILILDKHSTGTYSLSTHHENSYKFKINRQNQTDNFINVGDLRWAQLNLCL